MLGKQRSIVKAMILFCIAALTTFANVALAYDGGWSSEHGDKHSKRNLMKLSQKLGLTETQKSKTQEIFKANKAVVEPMIASLRAEQKNLHVLLYTDKFEEAAIRAETTKIAEIQAELNLNRAKVNAQFRAILTPDQLTILQKLQKKQLTKGK